MKHWATIVGLALSLSVSAPTPGHALVTADQLADEIERRAAATSFAELEQFAAQATKNPHREGLRRLHHAAVILLNQSEFAKFNHWNETLLHAAQSEGDGRYISLAELNRLRSRRDQGDNNAGAEIARRAMSEPDWYARTYAITLEATRLTQENQTGAALKRLFEAGQHIPSGDIDAKSADAMIWETIGIALMDLDDLQGSVEAFQRSDIELGDATYPKPDFDSIYNMAHLAARLGDGPLARKLAAAHSRLVRHSEIQKLKPWDQNLCAIVEEAFGGPAEVLNCLAGLDANLQGAEFLAPRLYAHRAIASARLGDTLTSARDLARFQALKASGQFSPSDFKDEDHIKAELTLAAGRPAEAFDLERQFHLRQEQATARRVSGGVHQVTSSLQSQLATARRAADMQHDAIIAQRWVMGFATLLLGGIVGVLIWQRRVSRRLGAAHAKAEAASRSKSEFLANMSHEIRTPLNGVVGVADMLVAANLPAREKEMARIIRDSGQSLERLLSDVLDLARVEAGQLVIETAPFHAGDLVRAVSALSRLRADEKGLALITHIDPTLEHWFLGDAVRVRQILINLVSNAVKFTAAGAVTLVAEPTACGLLRFSVADTGIGFGSAEKARLFQRFQQADGSITRRFGGTGLGLAISNQLATLMGGVMDCESRPGKGSRFWFEAQFPATEVAEDDDNAPQVPVAQEGRPIRVLVADDHATNQTVVRMILEQFGIEAICVDDGAQAVAALQLEQFDLVLMDMQMPVMDGLEATRQIRRHEFGGGHRTPILMLTANALAEHREAGRLAGADGHISKPITAQALLTALNAALESPSAEPLVATA